MNLASRLFADAADDEVEDDGGIDGRSCYNLGGGSWSGAKGRRVLRFAQS
jgi:hypothetical protein